MSSDLRDGVSNARQLLLERVNYPRWKARMKAFLRSINENAWYIIEDGYSRLVKTDTDDTTIPNQGLNGVLQKQENLIGILRPSMYCFVVLMNNFFNSSRIARFPSNFGTFLRLHMRVLVP